MTKNICNTVGPQNPTPAPSPLVSLAMPDSEKPATDGPNYGTALTDNVPHDKHVVSMIWSSNDLKNSL
jgi:hypothetical protein